MLCTGKFLRSCGIVFKLLCRQYFVLHLMLWCDVFSPFPWQRFAMYLGETLSYDFETRPEINALCSCSIGAPKSNSVGTFSCHLNDWCAHSSLYKLHFVFFAKYTRRKPLPWPVRVWEPVPLPAARARTCTTTSGSDTHFLMPAVENLWKLFAVVALSATLSSSVRPIVITVLQTVKQLSWSK